MDHSDGCGIGCALVGVVAVICGLVWFFGHYGVIAGLLLLILIVLLF